jgi:hypothetical protein
MISIKECGSKMKTRAAAQAGACASRSVPWSARVLEYVIASDDGSEVAGGQRRATSRARERHEIRGDEAGRGQGLVQYVDELSPVLHF